MTTRIELMGENVYRWLESRRISNDRVVNQRFVVGEIADISGAYDTVVGKVGVDFKIEGEVRKVIFDCNDAKVLQGKHHRQTRVVEITREGFGKQNLTSGVDLLVSTDAFGRSKP